jgi:hypothetical protein
VFRKGHEPGVKDVDPVERRRGKVPVVLKDERLRGSLLSAVLAHGIDAAAVCGDIQQQARATTRLDESPPEILAVRIGTPEEVVAWRAPLDREEVGTVHRDVVGVSKAEIGVIAQHAAVGEIQLPQEPLAEHGRAHDVHPRGVHRHTGRLLVILSAELVRPDQSPIRIVANERVAVAGERSRGLSAT